MCVLYQCLKVADTVVACACLEDVAEGQRAEGCVASRTAAADGGSVFVNFTAGNKVAHPVHAVINVNNSPLTVKSLAIRASIAGAAAVIHVEDGDTAARQVLNLQIERRRSRPGWSTMANNNQRWAFVGREVQSWFWGG